MSPDSRACQIGVRDPEDPSGPILPCLMRALGLADPEDRVVPFPDPGARGPAIANGTVVFCWLSGSQAARFLSAGSRRSPKYPCRRPDFQAEVLWFARIGLDRTKIGWFASFVLWSKPNRWIDPSSDPPGGDRHPGWNAEDHGSRGGARLPTARREGRQPSPRRPAGRRPGWRTVLEMLEEVGALSPPSCPETRPRSLSDTSYLQK